jgi:hypothetical protein
MRDDIKNKVIYVKNIENAKRSESKIKLSRSVTLKTFIDNSSISADSKKKVYP